MTNNFNDPREMIVDSVNGVTYEQDNRIEEMYHWQSKVIDLCDMPIEEYMKHPTIKKKSEEKKYIKYLKSIGCVVYLPLSEEGDLQDRISGESLQLSGNGSMTWDSSQNMYRIKTPSVQFQYVALLSNGLTKDMFPNNCFTTLSTFRKITTAVYTGACQFAPLSTDDNTIISMNPMYNASINTTNYPYKTVKLGRIEAEDGRYFYQEGGLYGTIAASPSLLPSNWVQNNSGLMLGMVRKYDTAYISKQFYIKDIYIFNTKLTLEQIRKIQGYE